MKRLLLFALAAGGLLAASHAPAAVAPREIQTYPYRNLVAPPGGVASVAGGPGIVLSDNIKETVVVQYTDGGPCGSMNRFDPQPGEPGGKSESQAESSGNGPWIVIAAVAVVGVGLAVVLIFFRRSGV